jgi:hypothetical protein
MGFLIDTNILSEVRDVERSGVSLLNPFSDATTP